MIQLGFVWIKTNPITISSSQLPRAVPSRNLRVVTVIASPHHMSATATKTVSMPRMSKDAPLNQRLHLAHVKSFSVATASVYRTLGNVTAMLTAWIGQTNWNAVQRVLPRNLRVENLARVFQFILIVTAIVTVQTDQTKKPVVSSGVFPYFSFSAVNVFCLRNTEGSIPYRLSKSISFLAKLKTSLQSVSSV